MTAAHINVRKPYAGLTMNVRIRVTREARIRLKIATWLIRLGVRIGGGVANVNEE